MLEKNKEQKRLKTDTSTEATRKPKQRTTVLSTNARAENALDANELIYPNGVILVRYCAARFDIKMLTWRLSLRSTAAELPKTSL